jgi:lysozyme
MAFILAVTMSLAPFTKSYEGEVYKAYKDIGGTWTICTGHTKNVRMGDIASKALCLKYYNEDMSETLNQIIKVSPEIVENFNASQAASDFTFNTGIGTWVSSPMYKYTKVKDWVNVCKSFSGYYVGVTYNKPQKDMVCKPHPKKQNKYLCNVKGLIDRREGEMKLCQNGIGIPMINPDEMLVKPDM